MIVKERPCGRSFVFYLLLHHYLGDNVQDLLVAASAACGAVGHLLHVLECLAVASFVAVSALN